MINFNDKDFRTANLISVVSIFLLVVMGGYMIFGNKPSYKVTRSTLHKREMAARLDTEKAETRATLAKDTVASRSWPPGAEKIAPLALDKVNTYVAKTGVRLLAFRPQRALPGKDLQSVPYLVSVEGPYPKVMQFCQSLDRDETKLAVNLIQLSSADNASDRVTASVGIIAFARVEPVDDKAKTTSTTPATETKPITGAKS